MELLQGFLRGRTEGGDLVAERTGTRSSDCIAIAVQKFLEEDDLGIYGTLGKKLGDEGGGCRETATRDWSAY